MFRKRPLFLSTALLTLLAVLFWHGTSFAASPEESDAHRTSFYDVTDDTLYSPYIQKLYDAHLITGDTDDGEETYRYRPKDSLTRAEFTKVAVGIKLAEKYGVKEDWQSKSAYEITETVLKEKLLYFHGCSNADLPNCTSLCGADICGVCNVCQLTNEKPFTDVAVKSRDCEEQGVCTPWYSEYIYYALRKGMLQGYHEGNTWAFHPNDPILRIHALKLIMADSGAVDPEADERYRRLSQTAKSRGAYYPKCLSGAENIILSQNGGGADAEKLLKYALLADKLDFFGNTCQVFNEAGARTPEARATFLHSTMTRQEVARYFVLSTSYSPLQFSAKDDPTVEETVSLLKDPDAPTKEDTPSSQLPAPSSADPTLKVYAENIPIHTDPFESTYNRSACIKSLSTPRLCKDASTANCINVSDGAKVTTTDEELYGRTPTGYYTWLWHGVIYNGKNYYVPTDDLNFNCTVKASIVKSVVKMASAPVSETVATKVKKVSYPSPDCGVIMSCDPIITYETAYETITRLNPGKCGVNMSCKTDTAKNEMPWIETANIFGKNGGTKEPKKAFSNPKCGVTMSCNPVVQKPASNGDWIGNNSDFVPIVELKTMPDAISTCLTNCNPAWDFVMTTGGWITENLGNPVGEFTRNTIVEPTRDNVIDPIVVMIEEGMKDPQKCLTEGGEQVILNNYTDKVNLCGMAGQIGLSISGFDAPADLVNIQYDLSHWQWSWGHAGQTFMDGIGLAPVVGVLKLGDEAGALYKTSKNLADLKKGAKKLDQLVRVTKDVAAKQPLNNLDELIQLAKNKWPTFNSKLDDAAKIVGGKAEITDVKSMTRATDKAIVKGADSVKDILRGTITYDSIPDLMRSIPELEKMYKIEKVENSIYDAYKSGYRDVKLIVKDKDGFLSEIQLMPKEMFDAKNIEKPIYDISRELTDGTKNLKKIEEARDVLSKTSPEIYEAVRGDIDDIIKHVIDEENGLPNESLDALRKVSKEMIYEPAWAKVKR